MRYYPRTYRGARAELLRKVNRLDGKRAFPQESVKCLTAYIKAANTNDGEKLPTNTPWSLETNNRAGYQNDIPGLMSELIAQWNLCGKYGDESLRIAQDEQTQRYDCIDFFINEDSYQCKTFRFDGKRMSVQRSWFNGIAKYLALVDIDDHKCYIIEREKLEKLYDEKRGWFYVWDLEEISTLHWDNTNDY